MFLFVGEKPSVTAFNKQYTWETGKLAARTLFDALDNVPVLKEHRHFINLFGNDPSAPEKETDYTMGQINIIKHAPQTIVAMGQKVGTILDKHGIEHLKIIHPAARGKIRKKELYHQHVKNFLG